MAGALDGKVTLVTGAGSGIGQACALRLAEEGGALVLVGREEAKLRETAGRITGAEVVTHAADIADAAAVAGIVRAVTERFGRLDILVNAAGLNVPQRALADVSHDDYRLVIDVDLNGAFYLT